MRDSLYDFSSNLLNVAVIKSILPAVHAFDHFEVFVDLSLLVSIPKGVVVWWGVKGVLLNVVAFGAAGGGRWQSGHVGLV